MLDQIWTVLTTLSEEAQKAAIAKCKELGFPLDRGIVGLDESFRNLADARSLLMDAIKKKKLIQLPISVQRILLENLQAISSTLTSLTAGADEVVNLAAAIETLNTSIWQYGFHNLADEVLGYQTKLNELKSLRLEVNRIRRDLEEGLAQKAEVERLKTEVETSAAGMKAQLATSQAEGQKVTEALARATEVDQKAAAALSSIEQRETASGQLVASAKASTAEVAALEVKIKEFYRQIDEYRAKLAAAVDGASKSVEENNDRTSALIAELHGLEGQIKEQIQRATGFTLFHSFQKRQEDLGKAKWRWALALCVFVALSIGLTVWILLTATVINEAFYLKISMSLPLIYAITFCTVQYSRERRLEEEYAFKSNVSLSLSPYQELVSKLIDKDKPEELAKYSKFVIDSVDRVFTSPTQQVFEGEAARGVDVAKVAKQLKILLEPVGEILKHVK